ncbi:hypothetical protein [Leifsonia aquatica]|uniref:hypothetical protein n=1 Tax=Leifsonia aquatica TaxID=144185 RepID=UPI003802FCDD
MTAQRVFRAVLLHDEDARDYSLLVELLDDAAPERLRIPTVYAGAAAFDVYELVDDSDWPEQALFRHTGMIPRTTTDQDDPS